MSYGRSASRYGSSYNISRGRVGQLDFRNIFDQTVVTPAEQIARFAVLGAAGGVAASLILLLGTSTVSKAKRWPVAGLIALPAAAAVGGVALANAGYRS